MKERKIAKAVTKRFGRAVICTGLAVMLTGGMLAGCAARGTDARQTKAPAVMGSVPADTTPAATTIAETTVPETTAQETTPAETAPETTPVKTTPAETQPPVTTPKPTEPAATKPEATQPQPTEPKPTEGSKPTTDPTNPHHSHSFGDWYTVVEPTNYDNGLAERKCSVCGTTESKTLDKLSENHKHSYTGKVTTEPTCARVGVKTYTCSCGSFYTEDVAPTGDHKCVSSIVEPTCVNDGYTVYTCSVCGWCEYGNYVEETGHTYSEETVVEPICTEWGHTLRVCSVCGHHDYIDFVQPTGHEYTWERGSDNICRGVCSKCATAWTCDPAASVSVPEVVDIVNRYRAAEGLDPVNYYWEAQDGTNRRAAEVAVVFSHDRPDGSGWDSAFDNGYYVSGECAARGTTSAERVVEMWMNSPGHRAIIMSPYIIWMVVARNGANWALNVQ